MRRFTCCCCGSLALAKEQWFNRDRGYGLCGACADMLKRRPDYNEEEFTSYYGHAGIHWMPSEPAPACEHQWEEQPGEPPMDVCSSCGAVRY